MSGRLPCLPTESSEHQGAHCVTLASPWMPEWHASSGGEGGGGGGRGDGGGDGGDTHTAQAWHLHQTVQSLSLHHGEQPGLVLSPWSLFSERHSPGGTGGGGGSGGGGGGAGRQKAHEEHLHHVQCTAACLGWHMAVHRRLGVSPVWAEGQVAGRSYPICAHSGWRARQATRRDGREGLYTTSTLSTSERREILSRLPIVDSALCQ